MSIQELEYSAGMMSQSSWFIEFKKLMQLLGAGIDPEQIKTECIQNNLFGAPNEYRAKRMYGYLINRTEQLDEEMTQLFLNGDLSTQKHINLIAIVRGDRLFFEFLYEVYRDKVILGQLTLEENDVNIFFHHKENQSEVIEQWTESTKRKVKNSYLNCMTDAGLLRTEKRVRLITAPILDSRVAALLERSGDHALLAAVTGVI